ncbi:putative quinol monooxygenase [Defluviimonas sp. D31]|uniref:putative quinol monooxygenase n=1 Tax=Defluviimonas sp. D31 TaxID=3083253 RepID=UPI00296FB23F|nr:putative quinol monooxygenase [Defluviimonas sp. D31]MDW4548640.1 putative quinol monooxygenase [Defluviimonas sp. D31]
MSHVKLSGFLVCRSLEEADRVSGLLADHIRLTRAEPGCLRFEVLRSHADPCRFAVAETFRDRAAFDAHRARAAATIWARATKGIPRDYVIEEEPAATQRR